MQRLNSKESLPRRSNLADEIAAFANAEGGVGLIGVVRRHFLGRRGEGVGIILNESEELSGNPLSMNFLMRNYDGPFLQHMKYQNTIQNEYKALTDTNDPNLNASFPDAESS